MHMQCMRNVENEELTLSDPTRLQIARYEVELDKHGTFPPPPCHGWKGDPEKINIFANPTRISPPPPFSKSRPSSGLELCLLAFIKRRVPQDPPLLTPNLPRQMPRRTIEVRSGDQSSLKWRVSLAEDAFDAFVAGHSGDAARRVFGEGSLFSPLLFGKFFDPGDAFPLWEFESETLLSKTSVEWFETDSEYVLKAELPVGARKCEVEVCGQKEKVVEISGLWRGKEADARDWKNGRWWEHGFVRRLELPADANWKKIEASILDDISLEIKIPKNNNTIACDGNLHQN